MQEIFPQSINHYEMTAAVAVYSLLGMLMLAGLILDVILLVRLGRKPMNSSDLTTRLRSRPWTWNEGGTILLVLVIVYALLRGSVDTVCQLGLIGNKRILSLLILLHTLLFNGAGLLIIIFLMRTRKIPQERAFGLNPRDFLRNIRQGIIFCVAAMPVVAFYSLVYIKLLEYLDYPFELQEVIRLLRDPRLPAWLHVYLGVLAIVAAPVVEELLFRGIALPAVAKHLKILPSVCCVSLIFAVMHFHVPSIVPLFVLSIALCLGYIYSGSIMVPIVMHAMFNATSLLMDFMIRNLPGLALCQ